MAVSKELYHDWKRHPVTQELLDEVRESVEAEVARMVNREVPDAPRDQFVRAYVKVADLIISWEPELIKEEG